MMSPTTIDPSQLLVDDSRFQEHGIGDDYNILDPIFGYSETSSTSDVKKKKKVRLSTLCAFDECKTQASFRNPDGKDQIYCAKHKLPGMVDFRSRKCEYSNCSTNASFNYPGLKKRRFCKQHAERGMIYLRRSTPSTAPAFQSAEEIVLQQSVGSSPLQSSLDDLARSHHIIQGCERKKQVDKRKCEHDGCCKVASFNVVGNKRRRFCKQHSEPGMQYVGRKMCGRVAGNNENTQSHMSKPQNEYITADKVFSHNLVGYVPQQQKPEDYSDEELYSNILDGSENDNSLRRSNIASLLSDNDINKSCDSLMFSTGMPPLPLGSDLMQSLNMDMNSHSHSMMPHDMSMEHINMAHLQPFFSSSSNNKDPMGMHMLNSSSSSSNNNNNNSNMNAHNMSNMGHLHHQHLHHHNSSSNIINNNSHLHQHHQQQHHQQQQHQQQHHQQQHHHQQQQQQQQHHLIHGDSNHMTNLFNMNNMNFHPNSNNLLMNNHMNFAIEIGHPDAPYLIMNDYIMIQGGSVDGKAAQEAAVSSNFDFLGIS